MGQVDAFAGEHDGSVDFAGRGGAAYRARSGSPTAAVPGFAEAVGQRSAAILRRPIIAADHVEDPGAHGVVPARPETRDLAAAGAKDSSAATNRVPISTPSVPSVNAAASPRPSITPPAATTGT
jgi:hypothetical protein